MSSKAKSAFESYQKRKNGNATTNQTSSKYDTSKAKSAFEAYQIRQHGKPKVDQDYINTFVSDYNKLAEADSDSAYSVWKDTDIGSRANAVRVWLDINKGRIEENTYKSLYDTVNSMSKVDHYYSQFKSEDEYNSYLKGVERREGMKTFDLEAGKTEIDDLQAKWDEASKIKGNIDQLKGKAQSYISSRNVAKYNEVMAEVKALEERYNQLGGDSLSQTLADKRLYHHEASNLQALEKLQNDAMGAADFNAYSKIGNAIENPAMDDAEGWLSIGQWKPFAEEIGNIVTYSRENADAIQMNAAEGYHVYGDYRYKYMTDEEVAVYNYYLGKGDKERAAKYLSSLESALTAREANKIAENVDGKYLAQILVGTAAGLDQFASGIKGIGDFLTGNEEITSPSMIQQASGLVREDLADSGFRIGDTSIGQIGYDLVNTSANMLPSVIVGSMTGGVGGTMLLGASAGGNAYSEMINLGYDKSQARSYAALVGASEAGLQYLLGGITSLGGKVSGGLTKAIASKVDNALARAAITFGGELISEGVEESLQTILEPWFKSIAANVDFEAPNIDEVLYSGLLGALSAGGHNAVAGGVSAIQHRTDVTNQGRSIIDEGGVDSLKQLALEMAGAESGLNAKSIGKLANKVTDATTNKNARNVGKLSDIMGETVSKQNAADIQAALVKSGVSEKVAARIAKSIGNEGMKGLEREMQKLDLADQTRVEAVIGNAMIDPASSVNVRAQRLAAAEKGEYSPDAAQKASVQEASPEVLKGEHKVSESGNTVYVNENGEAENVSIKKIVSTEGGIKVELDNGKTVSVKDLELSSDAEAMAFEMVTRMETTPETAQVIFEAVKASDATSAQALFIDVPTAYRYGKINYEAGLKGLRIPDSVKRLAFDRGRIDATPTTAEAQQTEQNATDAKAATAQKKGKVIFEGFKYTEDSATDMQKASMAGINLLAKMSSLEIHVYASWVENGKRYAMVGGKKRVAPNGWHEEGTNKIYIDINAGNKGEGAMLYTLGHEVTHHIANWNWNGFKKLGDFLIENFGKNNVPVDILIERKKQTLIKSYQRDGKAVPGENQLFKEAYEEVVAEAMTSMFTDPKAYDKLAELKKQDKTLWQKLGEAIKKMLDKLKSLLGVYDNTKSGAREADFVAKFSKDVYEQLQDLYLKAFVEADANYQASNLVSIDTASESVSPKFSERTWSASEYVAEREEAAKNISQALGVDIKTAYKYIDDINGVARLIADDRARLDYEPNLDEKATVLKPNSEYKYSVDMSTLCAKRLLFTGTFDAIQKALPNTVFDSEDIVSLREMMQKRGYEVACGICYVESTRREIGRITQEFIDRYKVAQETGKPITRINSSGKEVVLKSAGRTFSADKNYTPNLGELNTTDIDIVKRDHREVYDAYLAFMNARGQAKPKLLETRAEYKGEILKHFKAKSAVEARNNAGGLRLQSFSDFEVPHMIDMMQIVMDMSRVGLKSQAYTKVPAFAEVFGNSGVKINLSLIAKGDGLDSKGNLIFDDVEGINHTEAFKLRDTYSKNVGTILVGKTDAHIIAAMADPRIDYIIPFHKSSWKESLYDALGLTGYADYTDYQNEKPIDKGRKISNFDPSEYWDFTKTGDENAQTYLEKCREDGRIPKFPQFQGYPGYWKLLIDFKMYDNDGVGSPQEVVKPVFNTEASERILREYEGGHKSFPIAKDVVKDFVKEHQDKVNSYSERESNIRYSDRFDEVSIETALWESFDHNDKGYDNLIRVSQMPNYIVDKFGIEGDIYIYRDHAYENMVSKEQAIQDGRPTTRGGEDIHFHDLGIEKMTRAILSIDDPTMTIETKTSQGNPAVIMILNEFGGNDAPLYAVVSFYSKRSVKGDWSRRPHIVLTIAERNYVEPDSGRVGYEDIIKNAIEEGRVLDYNEKRRDDLSVIAKSAGLGNITRSSLDNSLSRFRQNVKRFKENNKISYSERDTYAPTFYSYMGKVVDDIRLEKMGAGGVVSYLKGKGVKDEEIKWSGIEAFLEGKKSVTKEELQQFVAGSQLQIEEEMSGEDIDLRYDGSKHAYNLLDENGKVLDTFTYSEFLNGYVAESDEEIYLDEHDLIAALRDEYGKSAGPRWADYKLDGGSNYRELVFKLPNSTYSNHAMRVHWGQDAEGILVHARIQDMTTSDGKSMLFIEELQSDWHNEGLAKGYTTEEYEDAVATYDKLAEDYANKNRAFHKYVRSNEFHSDPDEVSTKKFNWLRRKVEEAEKRMQDAERDVNALKEKGAGDTPDAPFRTTYHEYVLKRLLRMAAEEGYDSIGWTPADIQSKRWSEDYAEAYRIEYDQEMPKFLRKYGKKWGATVGTTKVSNDIDVWSMDITDSMKDSVLNEGQVMYQERDPDSISNRSLLANALESAVQNDIERNKLAQYKSKLAHIESEQAKLADVRQQAHDLRFKKGRTEEETKKLRGLDFEANQIANRINTYDRQLFALEATAALKGVLEREKQMAYRRAEQRGKEALKKQRERASENYKKLLAEKQESRKNAIESRHKTEMRHKIKKVVGDLNNLLLHPTKDNHVPIGLQLVVADALDAINMDTMNAAERVAYYNDRIAKSSNPDEIEMLTKKRDFFEYRDATFKDKITALKNAYAEFKNSDDPLIRNAHNEAIVNLIENTSDVVGKKSLKDMSYEQLEAVYNMYKAVLATVRNANKMFKEGRQETVTENSESVKTEVRSVGGHQERVLKITKFLKKFGWDMLKPITAMKVIGSDTLASLFDNVRAGEDTWAVDVSEAKEFYKNVSTKYGYKDWDFKKRYSFKDGAGHDFSLSLEQIMSLYAYSKRDQADRHLEVGGFIFDDAIEVTEKTKVGIPMKYEVNDANPYRLRREDLLAVIDSLSNEQKGFIDEMQSYLSDVMGAKGNEVSLAMYDIKLYNEKNYFPLKTSRYFREFDPEKSATPKIKNAGFSKKTVPQAGNPIVLSNFMDVWASHVNDMSMYHAFVLPLEDFTRVYNYSSTAGGYDSVQQYIKNAYGAQANQYVERLLDDLNGGARVDSSAGVINKGLSLFKKASVFASASVVVQQPSAIARAFAYVNPKYFAATTGSALNIVNHKELWAEVKKYAPVAGIKEMGYFDTGIGRSSVDWIKGNQTIMDKVDDALSKAPAIADELAWSHIWLAVKREVKATTNLKEGSEEFLKKAGKRFTEVIVNTQVYDSVLSRSGMMRSKDTGMKMATAFMAEPTTTANMMIDGIIQGKRGNKKFLAATVGGVSASIVLNSILVALVYAARDDDEDETYLEKYLGSLTSELLDGFNPLTYIPFVKDIWSIAQGYDVERSDMTVVSNLWESIERIFNEDTSGWEKVADVSGAVSSVFGIPLKNIIRDAKGLYNLYATLTSGTPTTKAGISESVEDAFKSSIPLWDRLNDSKTNSDRLYEAMMSGDQEQIDRIKGRYKDQDAITSAIRKALRENDPRIKEAAQADFDGDIEEYSRIINEIIGEGNFSEEDILAAFKSERNDLEPDDDEDSPASDKEVSIYNVEHYFTAIKSGKTSLANTAKDDIIKTAVANGKSLEDAESAFYSSFRIFAKNAYADGGLTRSEAERMLVNYGNLDGDDAYWTLKEWDYYKQNGTLDGYSKYNSFYEAVRTGRNLKAVISEHTSHGDKAETLASRITTYFKPLYKEMSNAERASLKGYLLNAYVQLGYNRAEKNKDINAWLKEKD